MGSRRFIFLLIAAAVFWVAGTPARAFNPDVLNSVVSVLPEWPGFPRGGNPGGAGRAGKPEAPEGSGVAVLPGGFIVTNDHVIGNATAVRVRLEDGRILPAEIVGRHPASDLALLKITLDLPVLAVAPPPPLAAKVCAVGNQFGFGASVTCGVVSARHRAGMGFNEIEDFIQTDASINPGGSGGALVDGRGRLVGLVSAIFTKGSDANIGVNFAASTRLVMRVVRDLQARGKVVEAEDGLEIGPVPRALRGQVAGAYVVQLDRGSRALAAGIEAGDVITALGKRPIRTPEALRAALFLLKPTQVARLTLRRGDASLRITLPAAEGRSSDSALENSPGGNSPGGAAAEGAPAAGKKALSGKPKAAQPVAPAQ